MAASAVSADPSSESVPPLLLGGLQTGDSLDDHGIGGPCRFDKYHATCFAEKDSVFQALKACYAVPLEIIEEPFTAGGYAHLLRARRWEDEFQIKWGGRQPFPNAATKRGPSTMALADELRKFEHRVTRVDAKIDLQGERIFEWLCNEAILEAAKQRRPLKARAVTCVYGVDGRGLYLGSAESATEIVIYDKTVQMRAAKGMVIPPNVVRLEVRQRPDGRAAGLAVAKLTPTDIFGISPVARALYEKAAGHAIEHVDLPRKGANGLHQSIVAMTAQYLRQVKELASEQGGWAELGEFIGHCIPEAEALIDERNGKMRRRKAAARDLI